MRAIVVGAVESTRVALAALGRSADWQVAAVLTLPLELATRHSDFVDLAPDAAAFGARLIAARDCNADDVLADLRALQADLCLVIGWSQICRPGFLAAVGGRAIGYHPAPLPRLRGRGVIPWTILLDEPISAASLFWIDDGVDSGPLAGQRYFHIAPLSTATTLYAQHMAALGELLDEVLPQLAAGTAPHRVQDDRCATWAARRTPADGVIDWSAPAGVTGRLIRAVTRPYPGATTHSSQGPLTIWQAEAWPEAARIHALPGQVIEAGEHGFGVACGCGGGLRITDWEGAVPRLHTHLGGAA